jgi:hypothetical protein
VSLSRHVPDSPPWAEAHHVGVNHNLTHNLTKTVNLAVNPAARHADSRIANPSGREMPTVAPHRRFRAAIHVSREGVVSGRPRM